MTIMIMKLTIAPVILTLLFAVAQAAPDSDWKAQIQIKLPATASSLSYSVDGSRVAVGHRDGRVSVCDVKSGALVRLLNAHATKVNSVQFILQDTRLLTIGDDKRARLWSTSDWSEAGVIEDAAFSGGASPDGHWLAAQDSQQAIWLWDLSTLKRVRQLTEPGKGGTRSMTFTADGRYIATAYSSPLLIDVETKQYVSFVIAGDKKTKLKIEQKEGNQAAISLGPLQEDDAPTHRVIPSRSGSLVALGRAWYGQPAFVDVWDVSTMKRLRRYKPKGAGTLTSFSFDNSLLAVEGAERTTIWRIGDGKQVASLKADGIIQFSPKTIELAATDGDNLIIYAPKQ